MKCIACGSDKLQLIKVFSGVNSLGWSPVAGEKDLFGNYKKLRPLLAHGCGDCGAVNWNIKIAQPRNPDEAAEALVALSESAGEAAEHEAIEESRA
ncbi:MAG: hypothetical protein ACPGYV_11275 [Phycisphaeraceae bacterium]